jgi:uncharacterized RDD family membrane protein YckC
MDLSSRPPLAGILVRFAALLLDGVVPSLILLPFGILAWIVSLSYPSFPGETMQIALVFVFGLTMVGLSSYSATVLALWAYGLTPGKWLLGIRVVKPDTNRPAGFWRMALRQTIGQFISTLFCHLGYIWALVDSNRQAWHDKIAKTLVIRTR